MTGVCGWVRAAVCAGVTMAGGALWLSPAALSAQQKDAAAAPAPAELRGNAARGRYLVERVAMCGECHSTRDQAGVIIPETRLHGGPLQVLAHVRLSRVLALAVGQRIEHPFAGRHGLRGRKASPQAGLSRELAWAAWWRRRRRQHRPHTMQPWRATSNGIVSPQSMHSCLVAAPSLCWRCTLPLAPLPMGGT